jgi:integrase
MSKKAINNLRLKVSLNKGDWLSEKIYSDSRGGCPCGGRHDARREFEGLDYPACDKCGKAPALLRIRAKIVDLNYQEKYIDIRHAQDGRRLKSIHDAFYVLRQVKHEIENNIFDVRKYDSTQSRESFLFKNFSAEYLAFHEKRLQRKEISPAGFFNKQRYVKELGRFFAEMDIGAIKNPAIEAFKNSYTDRFRTRDLALGELKSVLNHAHLMGMIQSMPGFNIVGASKKRKEIMPIAVAREIIEYIGDPQYQIMARLLSIYPVRPSELRALQWGDVDFLKGKVSFRRHFSKEVLIDGRKSVDRGDKAHLEYPLIKVFSQYLDSIPRPLRQGEFIFKGHSRPYVSEHCLGRAWRRAIDALNHERKRKRIPSLPYYHLYELRHARLTEIAEQSNGDIVKMLKVSGHTNPKTLLERYVRSTSDLTEFFS